MSKFKTILGAAALATLLISSAAAAQDPPSRVARLNYTEGNVSMQPAGLSDWTAAEINRPFTTGDSVYADAASRAEFHLDNAIIRAREYTNFSFLTLDDQTVQISLTAGDMHINLHDLGPTQTLEVDSPNTSVTLLRPGVYRFRIASNGTLTFVVVRQGEAEINGGGQAFSLTPGNSAELTGSGSLASNIAAAPPPDDFDLWSQDRDEREARSASLRYLPRSVVGYEDMDGYGDWQAAEGYGTVWYPRAVVAGWAPYHNGHWAWIEPWGWTWVDDAPWGFAPFHYGRWVFLSGRWGWSPGPIVVVANRPPVMRPVYAPALVAWFGGPHFGMGLGWVPLGFGEVYTPSYHCSPHYFNNVNVSNTTVVKTVNITNIYNTVYVNKTVYNQTFVNVRAPNAVATMQQSAFASGRSVALAGAAMRPEQVQNFQTHNTMVNAPPVAPTRQALMASRVSATPVVHPAAQIAARQVMVQRAPATAPAPFAARQTYLQQHVGETHDFASMHAQVAQNTPTQPSGARYMPVSAPPAARPANPPAAPRPLASPSGPPPTPQSAPHNAPPPHVLTSQPATPVAPVATHNPPPPKPAAVVPPVAPRTYPEREHEHVSKPAPPPPPSKEKHTEEAKKKPEHA
jgi:hypothetical protein